MPLPTLSTKPTIHIKSITRRSVTSEVIEKIKNYILDNNLTPGTMLPYEAEWISALGVGRHTAREAMKSLEALGILEIKAGKGIYVADYGHRALTKHLSFVMANDANKISQLIEARFSLELGAIYLIVQKITDADFARLRRIVSSFEGAKSTKESLAIDLDFHRILIEITDNLFIQGFTSLLTEFFGSFDPDSFSLTQDAIKMQIKKHDKYLNVLETRDHNAAYESVIAHMSTWSEIHPF